jgi:HK97 family phage major capsid protein
VTEQHPDLFDGHAVQEQLHGERIAEPMRVSILHAGQFRHFAEHASVVFAQRFLGSADLTNLIHSIDPLYRPGASFMMHDSTLKTILRVKDKFGRPLLDPSLQAAAPNTFLGYPLRINNFMPTLQTVASSPQVTVNGVIFGDFKRFIVGRVRDMSLLVLTERFAD